MCKLKVVTVILIFMVTKIKGLVWNQSDQLHPVHSLFVKPSIDGSTGDLYVAATEGNGVKSQWLADPTINILPATHTTIPSPLKSASHEEVVTNQQKIVSSPRIKYAYALPLPRAEGRLPYPYAFAAVTGQSPYAKEFLQSPLQYSFPQQSTISSAMNTLYESNQKGTSLTLPGIPHWPNAYSFPYIVMGPKSWTQNQNDEDESTESASDETS